MIRSKCSDCGKMHLNIYSYGWCPLCCVKNKLCCKMCGGMNYIPKTASKSREYLMLNCLKISHKGTTTFDKFKILLLNAMTSPVSRNGKIESVVPLPIAGGHIVLFELISDYVIM